MKRLWEMTDEEAASCSEIPEARRGLSLLCVIVSIGFPKRSASVCSVMLLGMVLLRAS